jgi:hypothetical protein
VAPQPGTEQCGNGVDDDCDGQVDEGCCAPGAGELCNSPNLAGCYEKTNCDGTCGADIPSQGTYYYPRSFQDVTCATCLGVTPFAGGQGYLTLDYSQNHPCVQNPNTPNAPCPPCAY